MTQTAIIIPARLESTRLPRKLLLDETGLPLVCHTALAAAEAVRLAPDRFAEAVVATDAPEILDAVGAFAAERGLPVRAELTRPDHPSGSDRIAEVARRLPDAVDVIVNLQGDEPEMPPGEIVRLADGLRASTGDIATLAWPIVERGDFANPNLVKTVLAADGSALYFSRAPIPFDREGGLPPGEALGLGHLGIYAYRRDALMRYVRLAPGRLERLEKLEQLRALEHGMRIAVRVLDERPPKGIDTEADYRAFAERIRARS